MNMTLNRAFFAALALCCSGTGFAAQKYGAAGCGLGSIVIGTKKGMTQIFAATTNHTSASQTFGITTGTSNCLPPGEMADLRLQQSFVAANIAGLQTDIARGEGESLRAFSQTLGCTDESFENVALTLKASYAQIFAAPGSLAVLSASKEQIRQQTSLVIACNKLI